MASLTMSVVARDVSLGRRLPVALFVVIRRQMASGSGAYSLPPLPENVKCGDREWVGYGHNGQRQYGDSYVTPFPAVRFRRPGKEFDKVKEKEKGDWSTLTLEDKRKLYRYSYCQTFAEMSAPTGDWKGILGAVLILVSAAFWNAVFMRYFVYDPMPESTKPENQAKQLRRFIDLQGQVIDGVSSKWDYENDRWK